MNVESQPPHKKAEAGSEEAMIAVSHCVCFASDPAFGHLAFLSNVQMRADCWGRLQTLSFRRCRVCEPGLDMCRQRAVTPDLSPKTLTQPSPILFTPSNHLPLCPVHWPDGCLIKGRRDIQWPDSKHHSPTAASNKTSPFCAAP